MASVTIRNLEESVLLKLKDRARTNRRSLEAELRVILSRAADGNGDVDLRALAERIAALTPGVPQSDSTDLLREDRRR